jgi:hypothetical protein
VKLVVVDERAAGRAEILDEEVTVRTRRHADVALRDLSVGEDHIHVR